MLIASIFKELRLLSHDLHGVAVLFMMPILFMLIMSAALSNNNELSHKAEIVLLGEPDNQLNQDFFKALQKENLRIQQGDIANIDEFQTALQAGKVELLIANFNQDKTTLNEDKPLSLWLNPSVDRGWLLGVKGVLQKHYTEQRIAHYMKENHITLDNNKRKQIKEIENKVNKELDHKFGQINAYLGKELWQEIYLNRQGKEVTKPNSVQHSVPAWLIFGMFFIMIPLSNVMAMERQTNTITRLRMARASAFSLIVAKLIPYFIINQLQFIGMIALGYFVLPQLDMPAFRLSGAVLPYAVLASAVSLAALGYGLFVSVVARTTEHAVVLGGGGIIIMAAIGGIMVPVYVMPEIMQTVAQWSPMGWALTGFQNLLLNQYTLVQIADYLWKLIAFGVTTLGLASLIYQHQLKTQVRF
ncbi:MAG TPA: ABC transporter permease [Pasteurellaceae bacterium]|nr:ABC transporter permease [Pasteurellaceae bacterium]